MSDDIASYSPENPEKVIEEIPYEFEETGDDRFEETGDDRFFVGRDERGPYYRYVMDGTSITLSVEDAVWRAIDRFLQDKLGLDGQNLPDFNSKIEVLYDEHSRKFYAFTDEAKDVLARYDER